MVVEVPITTSPAKVAVPSALKETLSNAPPPTLKNIPLPVADAKNKPSPVPVAPKILLDPFALPPKPTVA